MNVWVIGRNYPGPENNMSGSFELEQAKMLGKRGIKVSYLSASLRPINFVKKNEFIHHIEDEIDVFSYSRPFPPRIYPVYFGNIRNRLWIDFFKKVELSTGRPDIIHVHYPVMLLLADALKEYCRDDVKTVVTEHWSKVLCKKLDSYELKQQKKYADFVDSYLCVGSPLKNAILELANSKREIYTIPNTLNDAFKPSNEPHKGFSFICVGRLVALKQVDKILQIFAELFKGNENISLTIVGDGEERKNLVTLADALGIAKQIKMTGSLSRVDTADMIANSDCLICYSTYETFGVPVIEAWGCGIPAIVTQESGVGADDFNENLGILVSPTQKQQLKVAMQTIFEHRSEYNKDYIYDFARKSFSEESISSKLIQIYNALI